MYYNQFVFLIMYIWCKRKRERERKRDTVGLRLSGLGLSGLPSYSETILNPLRFPIHYNKGLL